MATFEITEVEANPREWQAKKGPAAGQTFLSYTVTAKGPDGQARYEISKRPESQPPALGPDDYTVEPPPFDGALPKLKKSGGNFGSGNQGSSGGTFNASRYQKEGMTKDDYWTAKNERDVESQARMGRAHAQEMGLRWLAISVKEGEPLTLDEVRHATDWFHQDVQRFPIDADVGGGDREVEPPGSPATADVSAEVINGVVTSESVPSTAAVSAERLEDELLAQPGALEASPAQKGKLTQLFGKAGLSRDAMKAVVLYRCRSEKATKDGASKLIQDLMDGATHDTLLAEIHDAKRAGDPLAIRAAKLIPSEVPVAEDPEEKAQEYEDESGVPF